MVTMIRPGNDLPTVRISIRDARDEQKTESFSLYNATPAEVKEMIRDAVAEKHREMERRETKRR